MDSIYLHTVIDVLWAVMVGHMLIGLAWAKVPALAELYPKTAAQYAAVAMETYEKAKAGQATDPDSLETCAKLAKCAVERADISLDYYEKQRRFLINMLWVIELQWTLECARGIERLRR